MIKRIWQWFARHVVMLPEPDVTKERQTDPKGGAIGFRLWFK